MITSYPEFVLHVLNPLLNRCLFSIFVISIVNKERLMLYWHLKKTIISIVIITRQAHLPRVYGCRAPSMRISAMQIVRALPGNKNLCFQPLEWLKTT